MALGALLSWDLRRMVRQERYFWLRVVYCIVLMALLLATYYNHPIYRAPWWGKPRHGGPFAERFFLIYLLVQMVFVVLLAPAAASNAVTEEKERRTLDDLLTTRLRDYEIILSKLVARLTQLTLFLLAGLPVISLTLLMGGVSPNLLWGGLAATGLTLLAITSLAVCMSVYAATSSNVVARIYLILAGYFLLWGLTECLEYLFWGLPPLDWDRPRLPIVGRTWLVWPGALLEVLNAGNFLEAYKNLNGHVVSRGGVYADVLPELLARYAIFHGAIAIACLHRAITRFRGVATAGAPRAGDLRRLIRWRPRPGRLPMWWKEIHFASGSGGNWPTLVLRGLFVLACLFPGLWFLWSPQSASPTRVNLYVRAVGTAVACVALLAVGGRAAMGLGLERERRTLPLLLATPLSERAIWWAKWCGSIAGARWLILLMAAVWLVGIATGGLHPLAVPLLLAAWCAYAGFIASLGMFFSVYARTTVRAVTATTLTALSVGVGPWIAFHLLAASNPYWDVLGLTFAICGVVVGPAFPFILYSEAKSRRRKTPVPQLTFLAACCAAPWLLAVLAVAAANGRAFIDGLTPPIVLSAAAVSPADWYRRGPAFGYGLAGVGLFALAAAAVGYAGRRMFPRWCGRIYRRRRQRKHSMKLVHSLAP
jgi:ABC-type transport system involved in multi-copper enzyme maturation permease subunit